MPTTVASIDATADPSTVTSSTQRPRALASASPPALSGAAGALIARSARSCLAAGPAATLERAAALTQREHLADHRAQAPGVHQARELGQFTGIWRDHENMACAPCARAWSQAGGAPSVTSGRRAA